MKLLTPLLKGYTNDDLLSLASKLRDTTSKEVIPLTKRQMKAMCDPVNNKFLQECMEEVPEDASTEERKPGWYWVKYCGDWEPVFYDPKIVPSTPWWRNDSPVSESAFEEIGARIEEPR